MVDLAAAQLLQYIQDPQNSSPDGLLQILSLFSPEVKQQLFSVENDNQTSSEVVKELLPAACKSGELDVVTWLLCLGANPTTRGRQVWNFVYISNQIIHHQQLSLCLHLKVCSQYKGLV